jgi:uncharacterized protein Yka (UPF0111/DUF47 family)
VSRRRWLLPDTPDILGLLRDQLALTVQGIDAFAAWAAAGGDAQAAQTVHEREHEADAAKLALREALIAAFVTPLDPEDLFVMSRGTDAILNRAKDTIGESEAMRCPPDVATAAMAALLADAVHAIDAAVEQLPANSVQATQTADHAVKAARHLEKTYRAAMADLLDVDDLRSVMGCQELYRRCSRICECVVDVAERLIYAILKEN